MYVEAYDGIDKAYIDTWWTDRQSPAPQEVPAIGYVAYCRGEPIACAFIRAVEGGYAQLDGLASNPSAPGEMRHSAIDLVVEKVMKEAKALGYKGMLAYSVDAATLMRSIRHGFKVMPHVLIVADL